MYCTRKVFVFGAVMRILGHETLKTLSTEREQHVLDDWYGQRATGSVVLTRGTVLEDVGLIVVGEIIDFVTFPFHLPDKDLWRN